MGTLKIEVAEQLHRERVAKHEAIVESLRARAPGTEFQDVDGATYKVIRVDSSYPRPGYVAEHIAGPYANPTLPIRFVGFDSVISK